MACPTVTTGSRFLVEALAHLDCQAQTIGSYGFRGLADPGSPAAFALTGLLTLFIALFAIRLLFGPGPDARDAVMAVIKIGIVMTLAVSWPAYRTLAYDTVLRGPAEVASAMTTPSLPDTGNGFAERLQAIDTGIASLTALGAGRRTGSLALEDRQDDAFLTIAMQDETALGWARTIWLGATIGSLAIFRIAGGLLLALAPLFAGMLLFELTRGLFAGWLRGLVLVALGSLAITLLLAVETALMEPWLVDALSRRNLGYAVPNAPTELLALVLAFALASAGLLFVMAKVAFQNAWPLPPLARLRASAPSLLGEQGSAVARPVPLTAQSRALGLGESVMALVHREERRETRDSVRRIEFAERSEGGGSLASSSSAAARAPLGSSYRRTSPRSTAAQTRRDDRS